MSVQIKVRSITTWHADRRPKIFEVADGGRVVARGEFREPDQVRLIDGSVSDALLVELEQMCAQSWQRAAAESPVYSETLDVSEETIGESTY